MFHSTFQDPVINGYDRRVRAPLQLRTLALRTNIFQRTSVPVRVFERSAKVKSQ
jgi:hypothetical protein